MILTNLSWVRNPYQSETTVRPNPKLFRTTMFNFTDIQTHRNLSERAVIEINYITKARALRYIASAEIEWLFPEKRLQKINWKKFGDGLLFMPDPRNFYMGGEITIGYTSGHAESFSEYGHKPWQKGYKDERRFAKESAALDRFKAEFAKHQGPVHRGSGFSFNKPPPHVDSDDYHAHLIAKTKGGRRWGHS